MSLLLHICCAPCMIYPIEELGKQKIEVTGFFYNPNIHPREEYDLRRESVEKYSKQTGIEVIYPEYKPEEFFSLIDEKQIFPDRCPICWEQRLKNTAVIAKEMGFEYFSTTLLVSPYQDQQLLEGIGGHIEEEENVNFYFADWRPGFRWAHQQARADNIYCQKYCGCKYSEKERCKRSAKA